MPLVLIGQGVYRLSGVGNPSLLSQSHSDYVFEYLGEQFFFETDNVPLKWKLTRKDTGTPDAPVSAVVRVEDALGNIVGTPATVDLDPTPPAGSLVFAALWTVLPRGEYTAHIVLAMPSDGQIRSDKQLIQVW